MHLYLYILLHGPVLIYTYKKYLYLYLDLYWYIHLYL